MRSKNHYPRLTNIGKSTNILSFKSALLFLFIFVFSVPAFAQPYTAVTLTGYNADVISNGTVTAAVNAISMPTGYTNAAGVDNGGYAFISQDYNYAGNTPTAYLPTGGLLASLTVTGLNYQLASYSSNNALWLAPVGSVNSGTLTFATPQAANTIYVLGTSGTGNSAFSVTVNFADGSNQVFSGQSFYDWYTGPTPEYQNIGRISVAVGSSNIPISATPHPYLYSTALTISTGSAAKLITGVTVARTDVGVTGAGYLTIFGVSMSIPPAVVSSVTSVSAFNTPACSISLPQSFTITGVNLTPPGNFTATAPAGFQVSSDSLTWGSTAVIAYTSINLAAGKVYVRFLPTAIGSVSGNITFTGGGVASEPVVSVSGNGTALPAITGASGICLGATGTVADATAGGSWSSSNTGIMTVGPTTGVVSAVSNGTANIIYTLPCGVNTSTAITVLALPGAITTGSVCAGSTVTLTDLTTGGSWSISNSAVASIGSSSGIATGINAGNSTITYTLISTGCKITAPITVNPLPGLYAITQSGGTNYCAGAASPIQIGLSGSNSGTSYQLYRGGTAVAGAVAAGTGSPVSFGFVSGAGTYTVIATTASGCTATMTGSGSIAITPGPTAYSVSGNTTFCAGGAGDSVRLSGSTTGINYRLYNGSTLVDTLTGTGLALNFGLTSAAGTYTVVAVNPIGCSANMTGSAIIIVNPLPAIYSVTGGGTYCNGAAGAPVGLSYSNTGINYSLFNDGVFVDSIHGTNAGLNFGSLTAIGNYTVVAVNSSTGCVSNMAGSATIAVNYPPAVFTVTGGGNYCMGGTGVSIGLSGSETTAFYQAYNGGTAEGTGPLTGIGTAFNLGAYYTAPGSYIVVATSILTGCRDTMAGGAIVGTTLLPTVYPVSGGGGYCAGGAGEPVTISNTDVGINYYLYYGATELGDSIAGSASGTVSFNNQTTAGTYRVVAVDTTSGCESNMSGTATIVIEPLPNNYTVTGSGSYCNGGAGRAVGLSLSTVGITYLLYNGGIMVSSVPGSGAAINFGLQTGPATYTAEAVNTTTGCTSTMLGSATINIIASPAAYNVTGGGNYCAGSTTGVPIGLGASDAGVSYQVYSSGTAVGAAVAGVAGSPINFGSFTAAGAYTVIGTSPGCSTNMTGSAIITNNPLPAAFTVTGGGATCAGGTGLNILLTGSATGTNYQLFNGGLAAGSPVAGTGASLSFGLQTGSGGYTVTATNGAGCTSNMTGSPVIVVLPAPPSHNVTGGGDYCAGGTGKIIGLNGSDTGMHYQLSIGGSPIGSILTGTGAAPSFGLITAQGIYNIMATNTTTGCSALMPGTAAIVIDPLPALETVVGGGSYCVGGTGVDVSLNPSAEGFTYSLLLDGVATALPSITGTGSAIDFGYQTAAGSYTIVSSNPTTGCSVSMTGTAVVYINSPAIFTVSGSATYCAGSISGPITISGSQASVTYQLYNGTSSAGFPSTGTGAALSLGLPTGSGTYKVVATDLSDCIDTMAGSAVIVINSLPAVYAVAGGGPYCAGGGGADIDLDGSNAGISYQLYNGSLASGAAIAGTGAPLDFGLITAAGVYSVVATNTATSCSTAMSTTAVVIVKPTPAAYTVTVDNYGNYCADSSGVHIGLDSSATGINYALYRGATLVSTITGTGSALNFGLQTVAGTYIITGTDPAAACSNNMTDSPVVNIIPLPAVYNVNGGGGYCPGGIGADVLLEGSNAGMYYKLYNTGVSAGDSVNGTGIVIDFGYQLEGNYTVVGVDRVIVSGDTVTCPNPMTGTAVVSLDTLLLPNVTIEVYPAGIVTQVDSIKALVTNAGPDPAYQWYINGDMIPGATQPTYIARQFFNGDSISCMVTSSGPCGGRSSANYAIIKLSTEGVTKVTSAGGDVKLVPNPNKGTFTVKGTTGTTTDEEVALEITNMLGQVVYTNKVMAYSGNIDQRIELGSALANGMYLLTLRSGTQNSVIHFVIEQ